MQVTSPRDTNSGQHFPDLLHSPHTWFFRSRTGGTNTVRDVGNHAGARQGVFSEQTAGMKEGRGARERRELTTESDKLAG